MLRTEEIIQFSGKKKMTLSLPLPVTPASTHPPTEGLLRGRSASLKYKKKYGGLLNTQFPALPHFSPPLGPPFTQSLPLPKIKFWRKLLRDV